ncbi:hypothetical protein EsH8_XV_000004 [Colletotrichum jinshuiense]
MYLGFLDTIPSRTHSDEAIDYIPNDFVIGDFIPNASIAGNAVFDDFETHTEEIHDLETGWRFQEYQFDQRHVGRQRSEHGRARHGLLDILSNGADDPEIAHPSPIRLATLLDKTKEMSEFTDDRLKEVGKLGEERQNICDKLEEDREGSKDETWVAME